MNNNLFRLMPAGRARARRKPRPRKPAVLALCALGATAVAACGSTAASTAAAPKTSTLVVVTPDMGSNFDFLQGYSGGYDQIEVLLNLQATLVRNTYVPSGESKALTEDYYKYQGELASGYTVSPNGLTYTFHLRKGVVSAAGNPLDAEDVVYSFQRDFLVKTSVIPYITTPVITSPSQFKAVNNSTVAVTISKSSYGSTLLGLLANVEGDIYDATLLKQHATTNDPWALKYTATHPNFGFGAYEVKSVSSTQTVLTANPHFVYGEPAIHTIIRNLVPESGARAAAVRTGAAQFAVQVLPSDQQSLVGASSVFVPKVKTNEMLLMPLVTNKAPFNNVLVRRAMAYAVPYQQILDNVYGGRANRLTGVLDSSAPGYDGSGLPDYQYNPTEARALLAQAGHPKGVSFTLDVSSAVPDAEAAAIQIQSFASKAGFTVHIREDPAAAFGTEQENGTFQAYISRENSGVMTPIFEMNLFTAKGSSNNLAKWEDPAYYAAYDKALDAGNPFATSAGKVWNAAEKIMLDQEPIVFLADAPPSVVMSSDVSGYAWLSDTYVDYSTLKIGKS
jgi:peptide/nickel transport system substrate-binding protein